MNYIHKYDSWLAHDEEEVDGDKNQYNDIMIESLMLDIYNENYNDLNELSYSMLTDANDMCSENLRQTKIFDFKNAPKGRMLTYKNRTIEKACIDDKQGNVPVSFIINGNTNQNLILNILANYSSKICEEYSGEEIDNTLQQVIHYIDSKILLDYYKELFDKIEEYYLNIGSTDDLYKLYENFYLFTNGNILFSNQTKQEDMKNFKIYILKQLNFLSNCLKHINQTYEKDSKGQLIHTIY